jgi:hypothetical protein
MVVVLALRSIILELQVLRMEMKDASFPGREGINLRGGFLRAFNVMFSRRPRARIKRSERAKLGRRKRLSSVVA